MSDNYTMKTEFANERTAYTVTIYDDKDEFNVEVNGVSHERKKMLKVAKDLRRAADLIEMRDAK